MLLTYGGHEAAPHICFAVKKLVGTLYENDAGFTFPEIAELERDSYGRIMVFVRVAEPSGQEVPLLLIFTQVEEDGTFRASPKCIMRVRDSSFYAGLEYHRVRNSWNCPIDSYPVF